MLSTLHTNDAPSAVTRLLELGIPPYLLNATLNGVMAQRLVRTLCPHCKQKLGAAARRGRARLGGAGRAVEGEPPGGGLQAGGLPRVPHDRLHRAASASTRCCCYSRAIKEIVGADGDLARIREQALTAKA